MMLLYGIIRGISAILRRLVEWKLKRAERAYELVEASFRTLEADCKADEVRLGRPADYATQLQLLRAFEIREAAKNRWARLAQRAADSRAAEERLRSFSEMRLPYTFGLLDMAFLMRLLDHFSLLPNIDQPVLNAVFSVLFG